MSIASINSYGYNNSAKYIKESFKNANDSITKLSSGKKYNNIGEGRTEENTARALKITEAENRALINNIKEASRVVDFTYTTLVRIKDLLQEQYGLVTIASNASYGVNIANLSTQFESLKAQIADSANSSYNGTSFFKIPTSSKQSAVGDTPKTNSFNFKISSVGAPLELTFKDLVGSTGVNPVYIGDGGQVHDVVKFNTSADAATIAPIIQRSIDSVSDTISALVAAKDRLDNAEQQITLVLGILEDSYSDIMDVDIAEISNKLVRDILRVNTATLAQVHSNNTLRDMVLALISGK